MRPFHCDCDVGSSAKLQTSSWTTHMWLRNKYIRGCGVALSRRCSRQRAPLVSLARIFFAVAPQLDRWVECTVTTSRARAHPPHAAASPAVVTHAPAVVTHAPQQKERVPFAHDGRCFLHELKTLLDRGMMTLPHERRCGRPSPRVCFGQLIDIDVENKHQTVNAASKQRLSPYIPEKYRNIVARND
jgi:hypothetical protein